MEGRDDHAGVLGFVCVAERWELETLLVSVTGDEAGGEAFGVDSAGVGGCGVRAQMFEEVLVGQDGEAWLGFLRH